MASPRKIEKPGKAEDPVYAETVSRIIFGPDGKVKETYMSLLKELKI
jgi:hypothetical protein